MPADRGDPSAVSRAPAGGAVPLSKTAGDDRHDEQGRGVEEHRDQLERRRLLCASEN